MEFPCDIQAPSLQTESVDIESSEPKNAGKPLLVFGKAKANINSSESKKCGKPRMVFGKAKSSRKRKRRESEDAKPRKVPKFGKKGYAADERSKRVPKFGKKGSADARPKKVPKFGKKGK